ncbi:MAG: bacillithiol biosynthesis cysteine-adding enzyme BshC [Bacteroidota bacterium]
MEVDCIPFRKTGYFSQLICDYLDEHEDLKPFYNRFPNLKGFLNQLQEKAKNYPEHHRPILSEALLKQYEGLEISESTLQNINSLKYGHTFTVVTGHQLNLFSGPLYFLYKIISTINLCEELKATYPENTFVPVYWMASEDHDFDEINYFNFQGKKIQWNRTSGGAVGRMDLSGLEEVFEVMSAKLGGANNANQIKALFRKAYLEQETLASATRVLANALFGNLGLVVLDGDDATLKRLMVPYMKKDIFEQLPFQKVLESIEQLSEVSSDYRIQVNPREINYFYLKEDLRERIVQKDGHYLVNDTDMVFTKTELDHEMEAHPERFSPNVIARPLYQEVILPNLCYIGGGGELAYWLELKDYFQGVGITFPVLLLRNSALVLTEKQSEKIKKLDLKMADLFLKQNSLINKKIRQISNIDIDFSPQKKVLADQFSDLYVLAQLTDKSFLGAVQAQEIKQKKGLDTLEKRLLKAQKRKLKDHVVRLIELQNQLFPNYSLQERQLNFSELYLEHGKDLIPKLKNALDPMKLSFLILWD